MRFVVAILSVAFATAMATPWTFGSIAQAQNMNLALSRLRIAAEDPVVRPDTLCTSAFGNGGQTLRRDFCPDSSAFQRLASQFGSALIPSLLSPAHTRGMRGIYVGLESSITELDSGEDYWARGTRGDEPSTDRNRFVAPVLAWHRVSVRKGLPFGFELGGNVGFASNTSYWGVGGEVRWALFEGLREVDSSMYYPELALRGAVQTLVGSAGLMLTVPTFDATLGGRFVLDGTVELSPYGGAQLAWLFADSGSVDLTPERNAFAECDPDPASGTGSAETACRGNPTDLNHDIAFPGLRAMRVRGFLGVQLRYQWFATTLAFSGDLLRPSEADPSVPSDLPRQWRIDLGVGISY